jgi:hypothetical protein
VERAMGRVRGVNCQCSSWFLLLKVALAIPSRSHIPNPAPPKAHFFRGPSSSDSLAAIPPPVFQPESCPVCQNIRLATLF